MFARADGCCAPQNTCLPHAGQIGAPSPRTAEHDPLRLVGCSLEKLVDIMLCTRTVHYK